MSLSSKKGKSRGKKKGIFKRKGSTGSSGSHGSADLKFPSDKKHKAKAIQEAMRSDPPDIANLRRLAISDGGLLRDDLRRKAWPKLMNVNMFEIPPKPANIRAHRDYRQVVLDVERSMRRFPANMKEEQRLRLQDQLVDIILRVLVRHPELHYYQGYHDICVTFLLVVGEDLAFAIMDKLSEYHLRDFMDESMDRTRHILGYLMPIVGKAHPELREFLERSDVGTIFALSWLITWYGHVLTDIRHIVRLYDFFLACHPLMPIYLAAQIVLYRSEDILRVECEMTMVHHTLSRLPEDLPFEHLVSRAGDLFIQYPPSMLAKEAELEFLSSTTISCYEDFEMATNQKPDTVLRRRRRFGNSAAQNGDVKTVQLRKPTNLALKFAVWAISASLGAAALAVVNVVNEWF
ncbi:TBCK [Branchiostoma lanceolatum]|uniref:TBC1 domain family member 20 n=2 Tax=Branchiostoma lanceolatum TaxID=7740 RepID=A0A8K0EXV9_BRALA|nr:TBCK [Branchiostoma lanceolatum]